MSIKIHNIAYHRNGVSGAGFHVVLFKDPDDHNPGPQVAVVLDKLDDEQLGVVGCFVQSVGKIVTGQIAMNNGAAYRGDHYAHPLRAAIKHHRRKEDKLRFPGV